MEREITPKESAIRLGVNLSHLYALLWAGKLKGERRGGRWFVPESAVAERLRVSRVNRDPGKTKRGA